MSELADQVAALVAEDGVVISSLNDLASKVAGGTATVADAQAAKDAIAGEVLKLQAAVAADNPPPAVPAPPVDVPPADVPPVTA